MVSFRYKIHFGDEVFEEGNFMSREDANKGAFQRITELPIGINDRVVQLIYGDSERFLDRVEYLKTAKGFSVRSLDSRL